MVKKNRRNSRFVLESIQSSDQTSMQTSMIMAEKEEKTFGKLKPAGDPNA